MISKRSDRTTVGRFGDLARYLAAARQEGEKLEKLWMENFSSGDSLEELEVVIEEAEVIQSMNHRVTKDKSYHLIVSFADEKPSIEALKDMERRFAFALGFEEHQRIVATHINTGNYHMHIAYNKVHPTTLRCHTPVWDYYKRDAVCRAMEKKWGLKVDNGMEIKRDHEKISHKARDVEAIRWEESFESHLKKQKAFKTDLLKAKDWEQAQAIASEHNLQLVKTQRGLAILDVQGKIGAKASTLGQDVTLPALEERLGPFPQEPERRLTFRNHILAKKERIEAIKAAAPGWKDFHRALAQEGLKIAPRGNGLAFMTLNGRQHVKASVLGKDFGMPKLEERFGPFEKAPTPERGQTREKNQAKSQRPEPYQGEPYQRRPRGTFAGQAPLWRKFTKRSERIGFKLTWREFLMLEALSDPLAIALLLQQRQIFQMLDDMIPDFGGGKKQTAPALWISAPTWANRKTSPWLAEKDINPPGIKVDKDGNVLVPLRDGNGKIQNLQLITKQGKTFFGKGRTNGLFHKLEAPNRAQEQDRAQDEERKAVLLIAEDLATGATLFEATGKTTFIAFEGANLKAVAIKARQSHPKAQIIIAADHNAHKNTGLERAQKAAASTGGKVIVPPLTKEQKAQGLTTFNDLQQARGKKETRQQIRRQLALKQRQFLRETPLKAPERQEQQIRNKQADRARATSHGKEKA